MTHRFAPAAFISVLALIPAFVFFDIATRFAAEGVDAGRAENNAAMFPRLIAGVLAVLLAIQFYREITGRAAESEGLETPNWQTAGLFALFIAYLLAFKWAGFLISTPVFLVLSMLLLGYRHPLGVPAFAAVVTGVIWLVFLKMLNLVLPVGVFLG